MHVLFVSIAFPPKQDPECLQTAKYYKYLVKEGVDVSVVTSAVPTLNMAYDKSMTKYDIGYLQKLEYKVFENKYLNYLIRKVAPAYLQTPDSKKRFVNKWRNVTKDLKVIPDIIYSRSFPLSSALTALQLKKYYRIPWMMHLSDPWADSPLSSSDPKIYNKNKELEKQCFEHADKICFTTEKTRDFYCKLYPSLMDKFEIFPNVYDAEDATNSINNISDDKLKIIYTGGLSGNRGPIHIINVIEHLRQKGFDVDNKIELILAGDIDRRNRAVLEDNKHPYLRFLGRRTYDEARELQKSAHLLLIIEEPLKDVSKAMFFPSKILDYLMARRRMFAITSKNSQVDMIFNKQGWESFDHLELDKAADFIKKSYLQLNNPEHFIQNNLPTDFDAQRNAQRLVRLMKSL
jgi:glycosyltransferase involved in cell wall biosynthesis